MISIFFIDFFHRVMDFALFLHIDNTISAPGIDTQPQRPLQKFLYYCEGVDSYWITIKFRQEMKDDISSSQYQTVNLNMIIKP